METLPDWLLPFIGQVPLVLLFMWYQDRQEIRRIAHDSAIEDKRIAAARENHKEWREFLEKRDAAYDASQERIAADVHRIRERLAQAGVGNVEDSPLPEGKRNAPR